MTKLKGIAKRAAEEWQEAPQGGTAAWMRCLACRVVYMSVHPFGMSRMECPACRRITQHEELPT